MKWRNVPLGLQGASHENYAHEVAIDFDRFKLEFLFTGDDFSFQELLVHTDARAEKFVLDALHGRYGECSASNAWLAMAAGVGFDVDTGARQPIAEYLLMSHCVPMLTTIVRAGVPPFVAAQRKPASPPMSPSQWLDHLCKIFGTVQDGDDNGFVGFAARRISLARSTEDSMVLAQALQFAWELDQDHSGFSNLAVDPSPVGAVVRVFLMQKTMEKAATGQAALSTSSSPTAPSPSSRRTSI